MICWSHRNDSFRHPFRSHIGSLDDSFSFQATFFQPWTDENLFVEYFFVNACMVYMKNPISTGYRVLEDHLKGLDCFFWSRKYGEDLFKDSSGVPSEYLFLEFFRKLLSDAFKKHPGMVWVNDKLSIEFLWWDLKLSTFKILNCEDLVCFGRIQCIQNQTRESMHWCSFSLQQFFGSEFSEHQKGPFTWEGKTAAFWEFTTMVGIINLTTNIIPWQRQWCKFISVQKDRHITPHSTWISVGFMNFRYPHQQKQRSEHFFFSRISSQSALVFFEKPPKIFHPRLLLWNGKSWVQKGWGKVPPSSHRTKGVAAPLAMAPELRSLGASQMDSRDHQSSVLDLSPTGVEAWMPFLWRGLVDG